MRFYNIKMKEEGKSDKSARDALVIISLETL